MESDLTCCQDILEDFSVSTVCPSCGLWWVSADDREIIKGQLSSDESPEAFRIVLRERVPIFSVLILIFFVCLAYGAVWGALSTAIEVPSWLGWVTDVGKNGHRAFAIGDALALLVGLPLGGFVGTYALTALVQLLVRAIIPAYLECNGTHSQFRMKIWNTWQDLSGFRRISVAVPCNQIEGVTLVTGQGGESQLFLLHCSGLALGTGWSGTKTRAMQLAKSLIRRLGQRS